MNQIFFDKERKEEMKKILSVFLILALVLGMTACGSTDEGTGEDGGDAKTYIVATEPTFPPFEFVDETTSEIVGFDIDLIKAIAADQGFEVEIQQLGFDAITGSISGGIVDIGASGMSITPERLEEVDFSDPYIDAGLVIAVGEDNTEISGVDDLKGKVCAAQIGTTGAAKAQELMDQGIIKEVKVFNTVDVVMQELATKGVDCVINDKPVTEAYISKMEGIKIVGDVLDSDSYGFAVKKGNTELIELINAGLANVKANGTYDELVAKYF